MFGVSSARFEQVVGATGSGLCRRRRCYTWNRPPVCGLADCRWKTARRRGQRTRFVPLLSVHTDSSMSTLSPNEYGNGGPVAIADATADLRKSIETGAGEKNREMGCKSAVG